jgi:2-dehydropantoate 2-reductase
MKIAIMGAGGVGGFYGGRMARAGEQVAFIARGPHLKALKAHGLRVESASMGDFALPEVVATDDPAAIGEVDLVWMTHKAYDLEQAAAAIAPLIGGQTVVIPLLNGLDNAERIGEVVGAEHMLGGIVQMSASIREPGVIRHNSGDRMVFGELGGGSSPRAEAILAMLHGADIPAELSTGVRKDIWAKYLQLVASAGLSSLTRQTLDVVVGDEHTRALFLACMREVEALAAKQGVGLDKNACETVLARYDNGPKGVKPSMLLDLERGRKLELEVFQGTAVRLGKELGVPTPVNDYIYAALKLHADGVSEAS